MTYAVLLFYYPITIHKSWRKHPMYHKFQKVSSVLCTVLYLIALLFILYGFVRLYRGETALIYFLLGGCFGLLSAGKKVWDKKA